MTSQGTLDAHMRTVPSLRSLLSLTRSGACPAYPPQERLRHPHLVRYLDVRHDAAVSDEAAPRGGARHSNITFIVTELVPGGKELFDVVEEWSVPAPAPAPAARASTSTSTSTAASHSS